MFILMHMKDKWPELLIAYHHSCISYENVHRKCKPFLDGKYHNSYHDNVIHPSPHTRTYHSAPSGPYIVSLKGSKQHLNDVILVVIVTNVSLVQCTVPVVNDSVTMGTRHQLINLCKQIHKIMRCWDKGSYSLSLKHNLITKSEAIVSTLLSHQQ